MWDKKKPQSPHTGNAAFDKVVEGATKLKSDPRVFRDHKMPPGSRIIDAWEKDGIEWCIHTRGKFADDDPNQVVDCEGVDEFGNIQFKSPPYLERIIKLAEMRNTTAAILINLGEMADKHGFIKPSSDEDKKLSKLKPSEIFDRACQSMFAMVAMILTKLIFDSGNHAFQKEEMN